jgi:hypothetical protein
VFRTERGTPVSPNHASRAFARPAASVGLAAHPHLLRHAVASAMAANKEPASIIAAQLRHADGGALAQRVYIHQLPQTAPRLVEVIEGMFAPAAQDTQVEPTVTAGRRTQGIRSRIGAPNSALMRRPSAAVPSAGSSTPPSTQSRRCGRARQGDAGRPVAEAVGCRRTAYSPTRDIGWTLTRLSR